MKKQYLKPELEVIASECAELLAGSNMFEDPTATSTETLAPEMPETEF